MQGGGGGGLYLLVLMVFCLYFLLSCLFVLWVGGFLQCLEEEEKVGNITNRR